MAQVTEFHYLNSSRSMVFLNPDPGSGSTSLATYRRLSSELVTVSIVFALRFEDETVLEGIPEVVAALLLLLFVFGGVKRCFPDGAISRSLPNLTLSFSEQI
ncbi:hypothetical protein CRG98_039883 [Punica granatum]|uniref:Uncharacterized protein n=1 Tax=Punica granatum TaxID=22663 RepID=A0A2I0I7D3_PUNGR|nr:hypothetical protein CRG98_039883 [Punica granatum]